MPNGLWLTADLNADGRDDLVHAVQGRDYVHSWLSNGDGTFRVGTFRPWAGYAMPNGLWQTLDWHVLGRSRDTVGETHQPHFLQHVAIILDARLIYVGPRLNLGRRRG